MGNLRDYLDENVIAHAFHHNRCGLPSQRFVHCDATLVWKANMNVSIDSLSRSLTPRFAPLLDLRQIDRIFPSEINS
jgi:hypothetical protein